MAILSVSCFVSFIITGCAQVGTPTGGPRDSIAPKLVSAQPNLKSTNFKGNKILLTFDEYVDVKDVQTNVLVSPFPKISPTISFKLKTVTIKLKDTLKENTTYSGYFLKFLVLSNRIIHQCFYSKTKAKRSKNNKC